MMWSHLVTAIFILASTVKCGPIKNTTELKTLNDGPDSSINLLPNITTTDTNKIILFLINISSLKNRSVENSNVTLNDDLMKEIPHNITEPLRMFLLIFKNRDYNRSVSLDDVARDFENENFNVEKIVNDGETQMIKLDLDNHLKNFNETDFIEKIIKDGNEKEEDDLDEKSVETKLRTKRKLKLGKLKKSKGGKGGGGGGYHYQPTPVYQQVVVMPVYVPVYVQRQRQVHYHPNPCQCRCCG